MKFKASILFAKRLLAPRTGKKSNARKSLQGAFLCIGISLIPLVMVLTVSNGMIEGITSRMIGLSSSHLSCYLHPDLQEASSQKNLIELSNKLEKIEGVENVYPELQSIGLAASNTVRTGAQIRAVRSDIFEKNKDFKELFKIKETIEKPKGNSAIIGEKIAEILGVHAGDSFRLITTKNLPSGKILPKITKFTVESIVSCGYQELDALWIFIPIDKGYSILNVQSSQPIIGIETKDAFSLELDKIMHRVEMAVPNFTRVYKWNELNVAQYENFSSTRIMLLFIMLLIVLVASINISSALVMLVMERRKEIAILKSLGATSGGITVSFLITGLVTGGLGVLFGIPIGLLCAVNFNFIINLMEKIINNVVHFTYILLRNDSSSLEYIKLLDPGFYLQNIPVSIPLNQLIIIGVGTLILSLFVSTWPAIKAGKEKPIETLRKI